MLTFYRDALTGLLILLVLSATILYAGANRARLHVPLLPGENTSLAWSSDVMPRSEKSETTLTVRDEGEVIEYDFSLDSEESFPYTHYAFDFSEHEHSYVDLTDYSHISFTVECSPHNVLLLVLFSFDEQITDLLKPETRRVSSSAFSCEQEWTTVTKAFSDLGTPHWWLQRHGLAFSDEDYQLNKTMGLAFVNSLQSATGTPSRVRISDVSLIGRAPTYLYVAVAVVAVLWLGFLVWLMRRYVTVMKAQLQRKVQSDQPLMAYKQLSIEPHKDKEKSALLRYMATEYATPDLCLERVSTQLGINRTKINTILKEELGLTFTAYLKKLRLTESARLLSENSDASISQVAHEVGYNNVSYFNTLFKAEYGCTPKAFQSLYLPKGDIE